MFVNTLAEVATYIRAYKALGVLLSADASDKIRDTYKALLYVALPYLPRSTS